ncbi:MAG: NIPSNAP family protein [Isosphaeraceae bacterium]
MRTILTTLMLSAVVAMASGARAEDKPARVFEMRTYYAAPGKMDDLHARFRDHTCALFKKHGMELIGFWEPVDAKSGKGEKMVYILAYPSREAATASWKAFGADPVWQKARTESEKNGKLEAKVESVFLNGLDYSAIK